MLSALKDPTLASQFGEAIASLAMPLVTMLSLHSFLGCFNHSYAIVI